VSCRSFAWEDEYELKQAPNRRVQRAMEKENKKLRDAAKKKRNEVVRVRRRSKKNFSKLTQKCYPSPKKKYFYLFIYLFIFYFSGACVICPEER